MINPIDFWKFNEELTVVQAVCLILEIDPSDISDDILKENPFFKPTGFDAVFAGITQAIRNEKLKANIRGETNWNLTTVNVIDLKAWLLSRNHKPAFFFDDTSTNEPDYMNPNHPRYSVKLAAAVQVWLAMDDDNLLSGKAVKDAISSWLENNYRELNLIYNGNRNVEGIKECVKVANWNVNGGATKTP